MRSLLSGVGLTSRRATEKQRHLTVCDSLLGQIIVDNYGVLPVITEPFADSTSGEGGQKLKRSCLRSGGSNNDGVLHGIVLFKGLDELGHSGPFLSNCNVHTVQLLGLIRSIVPALLVKNGVKSDGSLPGLAITNDKFTLSTPNGNHRIDRLQAGLYGFPDRLAGKNAGSLDLSTSSLLSIKRSLAINRVTEGIDDTSEKCFTNRNVDLVQISAYVMVVKSALW